MYKFMNVSSIYKQCLYALTVCKGIQHVSIAV